MKFYAAALLLVLVALQYRLWVSDDGLRSMLALNRSVKTQQAENRVLARRNSELAAEVKDLKEGLAAVEERARNDLGMIGSGEVFFQMIDANPPAPGAPSVVGPPSPDPMQRTAR
jgi:cell division protein FtsB